MPYGAATAGRILGPDPAFGRVSYPWQKPDPATERDANGVAVAVLREIFDADGPVADRVVLVREAYGREKLARLQGSECGLEAAEAFTLLREVRA